jgi:hypothetical protein
MKAERPAKDKLKQDEVGYQRRSTHFRQYCANCSMYVHSAPPRCTLVEGPIYSGGWCRRWERGSGR